MVKDPDYVREIAVDLANAMHRQAPRLRDELEKAKGHTHAIEIELHAADLSIDRVNSFQPTFEGDLQCPRCWIKNEVRSIMRPIPGTADEDFFRCITCQFEISIPA